MTEEEFLLQYRKFLRGEATPEEIEALHAYRDDMELEDGMMEEAEKSRVRATILSKLHEHMEPAPVVQRRPVRRLWLAAAALTGLAIGVSSLLLYNHRQTVGTHPVAEHIMNNKQQQKTVLTLANGKVISLTDADKGVVAVTTGAEANKSTTGQLAYTQRSSASTAAPEINTISTPSGEQFSVTLADGSKVRLNASSSLRFPVYFTGGKREVYLSGEAFFDVVGSPANPFVVYVNGEAVQALGTTFNIKAYPEEKAARATLISGAVNVKLPAATQTLRVGQQLVYNKQDNQFAMREVNTATITAWKDGYFAFEKESVTDIMLEVGRWYNMDIVFVKGNVNRKFSGKILRYDQIGEVLKTLEMTGAMNFNIDHNRVMVTIQ